MVLFNFNKLFLNTKCQCSRAVGIQLYFAFLEQSLFVESKTQDLHKYSVCIAHTFMASSI